MQHILKRAGVAKVLHTQTNMKTLSEEIKT